MKRITSRRNDAVTAFRELGAGRSASSTRLLLDGAHLLAEARAAGTRFERAAIAESHLQAGSESAALAEALDRDGVEVLVVPDDVLAAMSPVRTPSGVVAIVEHTPARPEEICRTPAAFVLVTVNVQEPGNVGALLRVAEAGGVTGVLVSADNGGGAASPFSWKALRGSMGSVLRLPVAADLRADEALDLLHAGGITTIAAVARGGREPDEVAWGGRVALVLGGEGPGLRASLVARCHGQVTIPMAAPVESLNVSVAAGVLIYAARRQRRGLRPTSG